MEPQMSKKAELVFKVAVRITENQKDEEELQRRLQGLKYERVQLFRELDLLTEGRKETKQDQPLEGPKEPSVMQTSQRKRYANWSADEKADLQQRVLQLLDGSTGMTKNAIRLQLKVANSVIYSTLDGMVADKKLRPVTVTVVAGHNSAREATGYALPLQEVKVAS